jgi:hypothetical protein
MGEVTSKRKRKVKEIVRISEGEVQNMTVSSLAYCLQSSRNWQAHVPNSNTQPSSNSFDLFVHIFPPIHFPEKCT